jgi:hypothetical protein
VLRRLQLPFSTVVADGPGGWFGGKDYLIAIDLRTARFEKWFPRLPYSYQGVTGIWLSGDRVLAAGPFCGSP